jgi:hypothetical protein
MESWFDGEQGWISDRNGASRKAAGGELDGMLVQALFSTGSWLLEKPPVPLSFRILESESTDSTVTLLCEPFMEESTARPSYRSRRASTPPRASKSTPSSNGAGARAYASHCALAWTSPAC